jgi:hypothetical protein
MIANAGVEKRVWDVMIVPQCKIEIAICPIVPGVAK